MLCLLNNACRKGFLIGLAVTLIKGESGDVEDSGLIKLFLLLGRFWPNKGGFSFNVDVNPTDFLLV